MRICFITSEIFVGKRRGGFGKLVKRGFDVSVICWSEPGQELLGELDGMEIPSYPYTITTRSSLRHVLDYAKGIL